VGLRARSAVTELAFTELGLELLAGTLLLLIAAAVGIAIREATALTVEARRAGGRRNRALLLLDGVGDDILAKVKVFTEVFKAIEREIPVKVAPVEGLLHELAGAKGLHQLNDLKVGDVLQLSDRVGQGIVVLLGIEDTLLEEVAKDRNTILCA